LLRNFYLVRELHEFFQGSGRTERCELESCFTVFLKTAKPFGRTTGAAEIREIRAICGQEK
jgi:hypothetical protein